jgi:hypothetical protein
MQTIRFPTITHLYLNLEGIPYHTTHEKMNLQEYIKTKLDVADEYKGTDPLLKYQLQI